MSEHMCISQQQNTSPRSYIVGTQLATVDPVLSHPLQAPFSLKEHVR